MAVTKEFLNQAYLAYFGRPIDPNGALFYAQPSMTEAQVIQDFFNSAESQAMYGTTFDVAQVNKIYNVLFGRDGDVAGVTWWANQIVTGKVAPAAAAIAILNGAQGSDKVIVENKLAAAEAFTANLDTMPEIVGYSGDAANKVASDFLASVTDTPATPAEIDAAIAAAVAAGSEIAGHIFKLTTVADDLVGTSSSDLFVANVVQNVNGEQTNQLGTGDALDGKGGVDTLMATVQSASALNWVPSQAITPETVDVEQAMFTALPIDYASPLEGFLGNYNPLVATSENVVVNAKHMLGLDLVASLESDASLTISNLTTLTDTGVYADRRETQSVVIRMDHTGNENIVDGASDMTVLFDNDYLIAGQPTTATQTYWWLLDQQSDLAGGPPLAHIDSDGLKFTIDGGEPVDLFIPREVFEGLDGSYEAFVAALNDAIADIPELAGYSVVLDPTNTQTVGLADGTMSSPIPAIVLVAPQGIDVTSTGFHHFAFASGAYNVFGDIADAPIITTEQLITSDIELFKVGRGADGGDLTVGGMADSQYDNYWYYGNSAIEQGVEQFNVTVFGDETQFSSLAALQSTNNTLRVVNVVTDAAQTDTFADLIIGNTNTYGYALKDVQTFDASGFKGDLSLDAVLTNEVTAKYLDLQDQAPDAPAADNVAFQYTGGTGNDSIYLEISSSNYADAGNATREDFTLNIAGGEGNDDLTLNIDGSDDVYYFNNRDGDPLFANWYDNQALLKNLSINGDGGDDTIWTPGSGNVIIDAGTGNDTVYADNIGWKAVWAFNVENDPAGADPVRRQLDNLQSDANNKYNLFNAKVTVDFKGYEVTVDVSNTNGVTSDLQINQAIKLAINSDPVLSQLLVATDGPGYTLVVSSLIDGYQANQIGTDLNISLAAPTALTAAEVAELNGYYGTSGVSESTLLANMAAQIVLFDDAGDYTEGFAQDGWNYQITGADSEATSDNLITGGLGNDVMVLGTGAFSNDGVKYVGYENGMDTVVNFETGADGLHYEGGTQEVVTLTFTDSDGSPAAQTIIFDGVTVNLSAPSVQGVIPAQDVASQFTSQYNAAASTNSWSAVWNGDGTVTLTHDAPGVVTDLVPGDFTGTYFGAADGNGTVTPVVNTQGADVVVAGTYSTFTVTYAAATTAAHAAGTITFAGATVAINQGDGSVTIAEAVAAGTYTGWTAGPVVHTATGDSVTFTATAVGATAIGTAADFFVGTTGTDATDGIMGSTTGTVGTAATTAAPVLVNSATGIDYLDFTTYHATTVVVDGAVVSGLAALPATGVYIELVESSTNAGEYTISEHNLGLLADATDDVVKVIGVADFGQHEDFIAANFHL